MNELYNDDCFNVFQTIEDNTINMVLVDLPYGQTACDWDIQIDLNKMWKELRRIGKDTCTYVFFTTTMYGYKLIESKPSWFRYDLVWEKHNSVGFLSANKMPLRSHEMIYIFNCPNETLHDLLIERNFEMREYAKKVLNFIKKPYSQIKKEVKHMRLCHFLGSHSTSQFALPTERTYNELIEKYGIDKMEGFIQFQDLTFEKGPKKIPIDRTYNPQKTPGKPYKVSSYKLPNKDVYGMDAIPSHENKTGDRHPTSVIKCHQSDEKLHPTQKPVDLCEWLIKTYSNENEVVLDFCMGSGSTVVACKKCNRIYIGIEKDKDIYEMAKKRIESTVVDVVI